MDEKYIEIQDAIGVLNLKNKIHEITNDDLLKLIQNRFVKGNPRVWWLSFKFPFQQVKVEKEDFEYLEISNYFDKDEECYFICELNQIRMFKSKIKHIQDVIGECSFFEYYVVNLDLTRLICETDHGDLLYIDKRNG